MYFEHELDLTDAVRRIRPLFSSGGVVYVEVPDPARYAECLFAPFQDFNTEYINHFGADSLADLFSAHGFVSLAEGTKTFDITGAFRYPACFGFFRWMSERTGTAGWRRAPEFLSSLNLYIAKLAELLRKIDARLEPVLHNLVIVLGVGQITVKILDENELGTAQIVTFVDGNPIHHGKTLHGRPIVSPEALRNLPPHPIVIGSLLHHKAIKAQIQSGLSLPNPLITLI